MTFSYIDILNVTMGVRVWKWPLCGFCRCWQEGFFREGKCPDLRIVEHYWIKVWGNELDKWKAKICFLLKNPKYGTLFINIVEADNNMLDKIRQDCLSSCPFPHPRAIEQKREHPFFTKKNFDQKNLKSKKFRN